MLAVKIAAIAGDGNGSVAASRAIDHEHARYMNSQPVAMLFSGNTPSLIHERSLIVGRAWSRVYGAHTDAHSRFDVT